MRHPRPTILLASALVAALVFTGRAEAPHVYAIAGARIVTAAGAPIDAGTVVIRGGFIEAVDRFGARRQFPLLALSAATVVASPGRFQGHSELARLAAELKQRAKRVTGSVHLMEPHDGALRAEP